MQLGFVSAILPDLSLDEVLSFARHTGYECVEIMCWPVGRADRRYAGVTHIDAAALDDAAAARIRDSLSSTGVTISGLGYYPNLLTADAEEAKVGAAHLRRVIDAAKRLELSVVSTFVGRDWTRSTEDNWPLFRAVWPDLIRYARDHGIKIAIENCPMLFTRDEWPGGKNLAASPAIWRRMFEEIPDPNFGLNYDPSHLLWQQMDYTKPLYEFAARIFRVHLKDARVHRHLLNEVGVLAHPLEYHSPKLPGLGEVDWGRFFSALGDTRYDGPVCVEVEDRAYEATLETRKRALAQSHDYIRQFLSRNSP
ncbi:MAG TPA: sugar phosphate isomerase/epimerase [Bryobacteraceae bacterium]|jgi:sugar phosphate isomerase/epimerase|nr:sugar phosphate isomerase/epimerase [Bryobacteraceae bacterium]